MMRIGDQTGAQTNSWWVKLCLPSLAAILALPLLLAGCDGASKEEVEARAEAEKIWGKFLMKCEGSYFYTGSMFDQTGRLSILGAGGKDVLVEFKNVTFNLVPLTISEAEHLNDLRYHGRVSMVAGAYRNGTGMWLDGPASEVRNSNELLGKAIQDVGSDIGSMGVYGAMVFHIRKYKGEWIIARGKTSLPNEVSDYYGLQEFLDMTKPKYDCATLAKMQQKQSG